MIYEPYYMHASSLYAHDLQFEFIIIQVNWIELNCHLDLYDDVYDVQQFKLVDYIYHTQLSGVCQDLW